MSDLELLFLVLAAFYGWECAAWLRRGSVAFITWLGRPWRVAHPGALLGNARGGFVFGAPLPPLGTLLTAQQFPLSLSPDAALAFVATNVNPGWRSAQSGCWLALDALRAVRADGKRLVVNGEVWLVASSAGFARSLAGQLTQIAKQMPTQRASAIRELVRAQLDEGAVQQRWRAFQNEARSVRWLSNVLVGYTFAVTPVMLWLIGLKLSWLGLLVGLVALMVATAVRVRRAHRLLYPDAEEERFTLTLTVALSPANAMRAHDALSRPLLETFHPLAVAKVFLSPAAFRAFARRVLLDLRHPALPNISDESPKARGAETFWRVALREAAEELLRRGGIDPDALCHPPEPADATCRAYCPRCRAQFTTAGGRCADCGGLPLVAHAACARHEGWF
jgi:hypothetical protein